MSFDCGSFRPGAIAKKSEEVMRLPDSLETAMLQRITETYELFDVPLKCAGSFLLTEGNGLDWLEKVGRKCGKETLIYCDPPYVLGTRKGGAIYKHEMTDEDHNRLLSVLCSLECNVMLSGYWSELYEAWLKRWSKKVFNSTTRQGSAREYLWCNFALPPTRLHDYRYLGENFREREKITRQKRRWTERLKRMNLLQRHALLEAIQAEEQSYT